MPTVQSSMVDVPTEDGTADAHLFYPDDGAPHPGVLMYMDVFGPRPHLHAMAGRLADAGYTVLLPNVFYRHGRAPLVELPEFIGPENRGALFETLGPLMRSLTPDIVRRDAQAYLGYLAGLRQTAEGPMGATGYCMGAALALRTAAACPERVAAAAGFHGANLATEAQDSPHLLAGRIRAEVYFGHADNDPAMPPEQQERLDQAFSAAGLSYTTEVYSGAAHGYTQADTSAHDPRAAERHWAALHGLLARTLR